MAGFRTSSKLSQFASNLVYTSPGGGTSSSVSISVVAPKKSKIFVQQAALGGVVLSSAQTYAPQTGTFTDLTNQINPTWLKKNAILRWTTHDGYGTTARNMTANMSNTPGNNSKYRNQTIVAWGEITNADGSFTATDLLASGPTESSSGNSYNNYYYRWTGGRYGAAGTNSRTNVGLGGGYVMGSHHAPMLDYRNDPARMLTMPALQQNGYGRPIARSTGSGIGTPAENEGMYGTMTEWMSQLEIQNNSAYGDANTPVFRYAAPSSGASYNTFGFDAFNKYFVSMNSSGYISQRWDWDPITGTNGQGYASNYSTGQNNPIYSTLSSGGMLNTLSSNVVSYKNNMGWTWSGTGTGDNAVVYWHFIAPRDSAGTTYKLSRWAGGNRGGSYPDAMAYPSMEYFSAYRAQNDITAPLNSGVKLKPAWYREINGYHYIGFQQDERDGTAGETGLVRSSTTNHLTCTWSTVTLPSYVDAYYPPIIVSATEAYFAQNTDADKWSKFDQKGTSTDTWTQNSLDYSAIAKPYVSPSPAVATALSAASLTGTGTRTVSTTESLYGKAVHTSDASFRNILSTYGNVPVAPTIRADDSDLTGELSTDFERTNLVLSPNDKVFIYTEDVNTVAQVYGYEE